MNSTATHRSWFKWMLLVMSSITTAAMAIPDHMLPVTPEPKKLVCTGMKMFDPLKCSIYQSKPVKKTKKSLTPRKTVL